MTKQFSLILLHISTIVELVKMILGFNGKIRNLIVRPWPAYCTMSSINRFNRVYSYKDRLCSRELGHLKPWVFNLNNYSHTQVICFILNFQLILFYVT